MRSEPHISIPNLRAWHQDEEPPEHQLCRPVGLECRSSTPGGYTQDFTCTRTQGKAVTPLEPDYIYRGFPGSIVVQNLPTSAGHVGSITGSERSPGERNGNPPQYSSLGIPMDREAWWATKSWTRTSLALVQNEAGQRLTVLPGEHSGHSKHPFPTT